MTDRSNTHREGKTRRPKTPVIPGQTVNDCPRPRVLVLAYQADIAERLKELLDSLAPTVDAISEPRSVDLNEYDCVLSAGFSYAHLTQEDHPQQHDWEYRVGQTEPDWWVGRQEFPPHLSVIYLVDDHPPDVLDFRPTPWASEELPERVLMAERRVPGRYIRYVQGLPTDIAELVKQQLAPKAQSRETHVVLAERFRGSTTGPDDDDQEGAGDDLKTLMVLRPLLLGPSDQILAATYERSSEASVWLLPLDLIDDLRPWVTAAFREWHELYPARFPEVPDWQRTPAWETADEAAIRREIEDAEAALASARTGYKQERSRLDAALEQARDVADAYERTLLTGTGIPLESAVSRVFQEFGFRVRDMDAVWPADARREDLRITDVDAPGWTAICEVKGFQKGVSEAGLMSLQRSAMFYAADEGTHPDAQWYVANSFLGHDPVTRQEPLRGRPDAVEAFEKSFGLLIDSQALFTLLSLVREADAVDAAAARSFLRSRIGVLTSSDVEAWVEAAGPPGTDSSVPPADVQPSPG